MVMAVALRVKEDISMPIYVFLLFCRCETDVDEVERGESSQVGNEDHIYFARSTILCKGLHQTQQNWRLITLSSLKSFLDAAIIAIT